MLPPVSSDASVLDVLFFGRPLDFTGLYSFLLSAFLVVPGGRPRGRFGFGSSGWSGLGFRGRPLPLLGGCAASEPPVATLDLVADSDMIANN